MAGQGYGISENERLFSFDTDLHGAACGRSQNPKHEMRSGRGCRQILNKFKLAKLKSENKLQGLIEAGVMAAGAKHEAQETRSWQIGGVGRIVGEIFSRWRWESLSFRDRFHIVPVAELLIKWAFVISALGGIVTGVICLLAGCDQIGRSGFNGAAYMGAAALAFGLVTIGLKRE